MSSLETITKPFIFKLQFLTEPLRWVVHLMRIYLLLKSLTREKLSATELKVFKSSDKMQ